MQTKKHFSTMHAGRRYCPSSYGAAYDVGHFLQIRQNLTMCGVCLYGWMDGLMDGWIILGN